MFCSIVKQLLIAANYVKPCLLLNLNCIRFKTIFDLSENTRRNPDLKKTSHNRRREFEETNYLNSADNSDYDNPSDDRKQELREEIRPSLPSYPKPAPNRRALELPERGWAVLKSDFPKWHHEVDVEHHKPQNRGPAPMVEIGVNTVKVRKPVTEKPKPKPVPIPVPPKAAKREPEHNYDPKHEYEYDVPDYYEYEHEEPVRTPRKPVKEAEVPVKEQPAPSNGPDGQNKARPPSVKRIGLLPEDRDSDDLNNYHWSPKDAGDYSQDKPQIPDEAYVNMKDFRNVEKQLEEDDSPNVGPEHEAENIDEDPDYSDYYEDDEEHPTSDEEDYHPHEDEKDGPPPDEEHAAPLVDNGSAKKVRYDDDEEVRQLPRVSPPVINRPPIRNQVPSPPARNYVSRPAPPPTTASKRYVPNSEPFKRTKSSDTSGDDGEIAGSLKEYDKLYGVYKNYFHP